MALPLPDLPDEVWNHIFQLLPPMVQQKTVSLVCKHWLKLIRNGLHQLKVTRSLYLKYFGLPWDFIYGIKISDEELNSMMLNYLKIWPYVHYIDFYYVGDKKPEDLLQMSLNDFKKLWNLPFLKSLKMNVKCQDYWSASFSGITFKQNSTIIPLVHFYCEEDELHRVFSEFKSFMKILKGKEVEALSIGRGKYMKSMSQNQEYVSLMKDFLTSNVNNIANLYVTDHDGKSQLKTVLEPLMKPNNCTLNHIYLAFDEDRGISKDFRLLQNLNHLTSLRIDRAAFRYEDFNLLAQNCLFLEVFHFEGASERDSGFTFVPISRLGQFLTEFKSMKTIKDMRIVNISPVNRTRTPQEIEEYLHDCLHPQDCISVEADVKGDAELHLVDVMKDAYSKNCFIFILFYNIHYLSINETVLNDDHPNKKSLLLAKNRETHIRVEFTKHDELLQFPEYFEEHGVIKHGVNGKLISK